MFASEKGCPSAPVERRGAVSGEHKMKKKKKNEPEKKKKKGCRVWGCGTTHPRTRHAVSRPRTRRERGLKGGVSQSEVREGAPPRVRARPRVR